MIVGEHDVPRFYLFRTVDAVSHSLFLSFPVFFPAAFPPIVICRARLFL